MKQFFKLSIFFLTTLIVGILLFPNFSRATTIDVQVGASADDGYVNTAAWFYNTVTTSEVGAHYGSGENAFLRFTGISGLGGATINAMYVSYYTSTSTGTAWLSNFYAEATASPAQMTSYANYNSRVKTSASVALNTTPGAGWQNSPSLVSIGQELANSYDPTAIQILWEWAGMYNDNWYQFYNWDYLDHSYTPKLHIEYTTSPKYLISRYNNAGWKAWLNGSGNFCFGIDDDATWSPDDSVCSSGTDYGDKRWHHLEVVKNGTSGIYLYVDGVLVGSKASLVATGSLSGSSPVLYAGIDSDGSSNPWQGAIDDVRIYNYVRTPEQIRQDYNAGFSTYFR